MNPDCEICEFLQKPPKHQLLTPKYWTAGVLNDQPYLGRAIVSLRAHKGSLSELSDEEWAEFHDIVRILEPAYQKALGASPLNWGCFMNHGFRSDPPMPHVHWHIFPRYKETQTIHGLTFEDELYGSFYDNSIRRPVSDDVVEEIVAKLKAEL